MEQSPSPESEFGNPALIFAEDQYSLFAKALGASGIWEMPPSDMKASEWMRSHANTCIEEDVKILAFYEGHQWDPEVLEERLSRFRPTIVINKLPGIVRSLIMNEERSAHDMSEASTRELILAVTREYRDAQRLYNYMYSSLFELNLQRLGQMA